MFSACQGKQEVETYNWSHKSTYNSLLLLKNRNEKKAENLCHGVGNLGERGSTTRPLETKQAENPSERKNKNFRNCNLKSFYFPSLDLI